MYSFFIFENIQFVPLSPQKIVFGVMSITRLSVYGPKEWPQFNQMFFRQLKIWKYLPPK